MIAVLDVSAALEIVFKRCKFDLFHSVYKDASWVIAPDLYVSEITNVVWKYYRANVLSHEECIQYAQDGVDLIDDFIDAKGYWKEALAEGIKNNHTIYDMYYAVLTRRNDATLITNDGPLAKLGKKLHIDVCFKK
jgi:predicted nucleic acid-binding protein